MASTQGQSLDLIPTSCLQFAMVLCGNYTAMVGILTFNLENIPPFEDMNVRSRLRIDSMGIFTDNLRFVNSSSQRWSRHKMSNFAAQIRNQQGFLSRSADRV